MSELGESQAGRMKRDTEAQPAMNKDQSEPELDDSIENLSERNSSKKQIPMPEIESKDLKEISIEEKKDEAKPIKASNKAKKPKAPPAKKAGCCEMYSYGSRKNKCYFILAILSAMAMGAIQPAFGIMFGTLLDDAFTDPNSFRVISFIFFAIGFGVFFFSVFMYMFWMLLKENLTTAYRLNYFKAILNQELAWFDSNNPQEIASKISQKCTTIEQAVGEKTGMLFQSVSTIFVGTGIALAYGWQLALVLIAFGPIVLIALNLFMKHVTTYHIKSHMNYISSGALVEQALSSIRTVLSFDGVQFEIKRYGERLMQSVKAGKKLSITVALILGFFLGAIFVNYALGFWVGGAFIRSNIDATNGKPYTSGVVTVCFFSSMMGVMALGGVSSNIAPINKARVVAYEIFEIFRRKPAIDQTRYDPKLAKASIQGRFEFRNVSFAYPSREHVPILKDLSIDFEQGKTTAIVGHTGSGKSTIVTLIERLYEPSNGKIFLDGSSLEDHNMDNIRAQMGYVGQEPVLYNLSIKENILFGSSNPERISDSDIEESLRSANAWDFVNKLEKGIETVIGQAGITLSGGQKQRIAIARAIINKPKVLLLDEATSALDLESEKTVQAALEQITLGITTIVIAHRLSTIVGADQIFVLDDGKLAESGTHTELLAQDGRYSELFQKQAEIDSLALAKRQSSMPPEELTLIKEPSRRAPETEQAEEKEQIKEEKPKPKKNPKFCSVIGRLFQIAKGLRCLTALGLIATTLYGTIFPLMALVLSRMMISLGRRDWSESDLLSYFFLILAIVVFVLVTTQQHSFEMLALLSTQKMRLLIYESVLRKHIGWHDDAQNSAGSIAGLMAGETTKIHAAIGRGAGNFLQFMAAIATGSIIAIIGEWRVGLIMVALMPFLLFSSYIRHKQQMRLMFATASRYAKASGIVSESVVSMKTVRSLNSENRIHGLYKQQITAPFAAAKKQAKCAAVLLALSHFSSYFVFGIGFIVGDQFARQGWVKNREDIFVPVFAIMFATFGSAGAQTFVSDIQGGYQAAVNMFRILDEPTKIDPNQNGDSIQMKGAIEFKNVSFRYPTRPEPVLSNFNLKIEAGQRVALVGASGCGKSTIIQLISRFYDPDEGAVLIDGVPLKKLKLNEVRQNMAIVQQEPLLFNESIKENIMYGKQDATMQEVEQAADYANALPFIKGDEEVPIDAKQPGQQDLGFDRPVGPKGSHLSGGQKQRVAIARAIIGDPKILMLDEATSALDKNSEELVQRALDQVMNGRTSVVIAHRLSTIESADVIHVIEDGRIVESGKHQTLLRKKGAYFKLYSQGVSML